MCGIVVKSNQILGKQLKHQMHPPAGLQQLISNFDYYQAHPCVILHKPNDHHTHLTAVATATELGLMMIQRYPAPMIAECLSGMDRRMHHANVHANVPSSYICPTCRDRVPATDYTEHIQIHAAAAFMADIFEPYDPDRPTIRPNTLLYNNEN